MIKQVAHVCFTTPDLDATIGFYRDVLGLEITFRFLRNDEAIGCYFHLGNRTFLECFLRNGGERLQGDIKHFCLETEDLDALENHLKAAGVDTRGNRTGSDGSRQLWCTDPNGIDIEFQEYTDQSCQFTGENCRVDW